MRITTRTIRAAAVAAALLPALAAAQLGSPNPGPGPQQDFIIRNARIVTVSGPVIERGNVIVRGGKIAAVGAGADAPGLTAYDATGLTVYPGMMDAVTNMGLSEIGQGAAPTVDVAEVGSFNPNAIAYYGINPHSAHIGVTRVVGITHTIAAPTGGIVAGQGTLVNLAGWTAAQMSVVQKAALVVTLPRAGGGGGRFGGFGGGGAAAADVAKQLDSLKALIADARAYATAQEAAARDRSIAAPVPDVKLEAMLPYVRGERPVLFSADRAAEIRAAVEFATEQRLTPVILGGREALVVADLLKTKRVPVLFSHVRTLPTREDDPFDIHFAAPGQLVAAGVTLAITSGDGGAEVRDLPYMAGMAAAYGMSPEDALKSVTLWPAQILGVADRFGSIEVGKAANLVVTTGDLLEARTDTKYLFIDGRLVPLTNKQTVLYETHRARR
jgi:imidazolonepropionase-like amidohydrolase